MALHHTTPQSSSQARTDDTQRVQLPQEEDRALRPQELRDFVGQRELKESLSVVLEASALRSEPAPHILFHGPPGLGKTTLSRIIAEQMGANFRITSGASIEKTGDLAAIVSSLEEGDVLFLDEIHRLKRPLEEMLYPVMEDFALDIVVGSGPSARSLRLDIPRFTLVAATTRLNAISNPLRDRFQEQFRLRPYEPEEIQSLLNRNAKLLDISLSPEASETLAWASRGTPRIANRLLRRMRDISTVQKIHQLDIDHVRSAFGYMGIDETGLTETDRDILQLLTTGYSSAPVGLKTLSAALHEEPETLEDVYEPYLIRMGYIQRTPQGRIALPKAYQHLSMDVPQSFQQTPPAQLFSDPS